MIALLNGYQNPLDTVDALFAHADSEGNFPGLPSPGSIPDVPTGGKKGKGAAAESDVDTIADNQTITLMFDDASHALTRSQIAAKVEASGGNVPGAAASGKATPGEGEMRPDDVLLARPLVVGSALLKEGAPWSAGVVDVVWYVFLNMVWCMVLGT